MPSGFVIHVHIWKMPPSQPLSGFAGSAGQVGLPGRLTPSERGQAENLSGVLLCYSAEATGPGLAAARARLVLADIIPANQRPASMAKNEETTQGGGLTMGEAIDRLAHLAYRAVYPPSTGSETPVM